MERIVEGEVGMHRSAQLLVRFSVRVFDLGYKQNWFILVSWTALAALILVEIDLRAQ